MPLADSRVTVSLWPIIMTFLQAAVIVKFRNMRTSAHCESIPGVLWLLILTLLKRSTTFAWSNASQGRIRQIADLATHFQFKGCFIMCALKKVIGNFKEVRVCVILLFPVNCPMKIRFHMTCNQSSALFQISSFISHDTLR